MRINPATAGIAALAVLVSAGCVCASAVSLDTYAYMCNTLDQNLCLGISPGDSTPKPDNGVTYPPQLKPRVKNEETGLDRKKTRWNFDRTNGTIELSGFGMFLERRGQTQRLRVGHTRTVPTVWDLRSFGETGSLGGRLCIVPSNGTDEGLMCLTAMECKLQGNDYCSPDSNDPVMTASQLRRGVYVKLQEFDYALNVSQVFTQEIDCSPGCGPSDIENGVCDPECQVEACGFDFLDCVAHPTASPTPRPTMLPSTAPIPAPTASPTSSPSGVPTSTPTNGPTSSPTYGPTSGPTPPTHAPTHAPSSTPSVMPTEAPVIVDVLVFVPTIESTSKPTAAPSVPLGGLSEDETLMVYLLVVLGAIILFILVACCMRWYYFGHGGDEDNDSNHSEGDTFVDIPIESETEVDSDIDSPPDPVPFVPDEVGRLPSHRGSMPARIVEPRPVTPARPHATNAAPVSMQAAAEFMSIRRGHAIKSTGGASGGGGGKALGPGDDGYEDSLRVRSSGKWEVVTE